MSALIQDDIFHKKIDARAFNKNVRRVCICGGAAVNHDINARK